MGGFKFWIETSIILIDAVNLWLSLSVVTKKRNKGVELGLAAEENSSRILLIVALGGFTVFLYAVRIFHIFYTVLKPTTEQREQQSKVSSMQGIFISRRYSGMKFYFEQLFQQPLYKKFRSRTVSLQLYGTREKEESTMFSSHQNNDWLSINEGRPDWEDVFWKAIRKAQKFDPDGVSIGVFFCGSPAIAKCLRSTVDKINAKLQVAAKRPSPNGGNH